MAKLIFIAGMPGSGKTEWLKLKPFGNVPEYDDFMANSLYDKRDFQCCRDLYAIVENLRTGSDVIMTDVRLCDPAFRTEVTNSLSRLLGELEIEWHCFENDPVKCEKNARKRDRPSLANELENIRVLTQIYEPYPRGAKIHPVENSKTR